MRVEVIAAGAISALGVGRASLVPWRIGEAALTAVREDSELAAEGLVRARCARAPLGPASRDRAAELLGSALSEVAGELDAVLPRWRGLRVGVALGSSSGGLRSLVALLDARAAGRDVPRDAALGAPYFGPLDVVGGALGLAPEVAVLVLGACASSALAIGLGRCWVAAGHVDVALAGGFDAVGGFVAGGFEALGVVTGAAPAPFRVRRDGLALGEGAGVVALARDGLSAAPCLGVVSGFGASADAGHPTAPDSSGAGLALAARQALADARTETNRLQLISAHGTGTILNDAAELRALQRLGALAAGGARVHAAKGELGHTLGAAGVLETIAALEAGRRGLAPPSAGCGEVEPALGSLLLERAERRARGPVLKLAAAFGGANAALVLDGPQEEAARPPRAVGVVAVGRDIHDPLEIRQAHGRLDSARAARLELPLALAVAATMRLAEHQSIAASPRVGVVVGTATATLELDARYAERYRGRGPRHADPRRFPATSPNLAPGLCAAALGCRGPALAVGAGLAAPLEALLVALDLAAAGVADAFVVVALEEWGAVSQQAWAARGWAELPTRATAVLVEAGAGRALRREPLAEALRVAASGAPGAPIRGGGDLLREGIRVASLAGGPGFP
ncbi:MAG: 3-oxoacyl-ACP synthase [Polyangiaceae bacterium]|nr:3-oxoacyl-ACP synthase [Polyangiaceae bacterium]